MRDFRVKFRNSDYATPIKVLVIDDADRNRDRISAQGARLVRTIVAPLFGDGKRTLIAIISIWSRRDPMIPGIRVQPAG